MNLVVVDEFGFDFDLGIVFFLKAFKTNVTKYIISLRLTPTKNKPMRYIDTPNGLLSSKVSK